ncbi:MAG TPA: hypothetical protein VE262_22830 [Blastocatellia bacterium]|nr:hypothetical protein [Blastocatellia bacterium]
MKHPFEKLSPSRRAWLFLPLLVITSLVTSAMMLVGRPLSENKAVAPEGIISYELARDTSESRAILDAWGERGRVRAAFSLGLDFLFIFAYATTISLACVMASGLFAGRRLLALAGVALAWGQGAAGILDGIENTALMVMLVDSVSEPLRLTAYWSAWIKFKLVYAGILYALVGGVFWGIRKLRAGRKGAGAASRP